MSREDMIALGFSMERNQYGSFDLMHKSPKGVMYVWCTSECVESEAWYLTIPEYKYDCFKSVLEPQEYAELMSRLHLMWSNDMLEFNNPNLIEDSIQ